MAKLSRILGEKVFPERRLLLQSNSGVRHVALPGWLQAMLLAASFGTIGAVAYLCVGFIHSRDTFGSRTADLPPPVTPIPAKPQPPLLAAASAATGSDASVAPSADSATLDQMRSELAMLHQQIAALSQDYAEANAS